MASPHTSEPVVLDCQPHRMFSYPDPKNTNATAAAVAIHPRTPHRQLT